jgi:hypothetical protein
VAKALETTSPNGTVQQRFVRSVEATNGSRSGLIRDNLALLVRHDGPGRSWEQYFTVVQWDHREAAETMDRNGKAEFLRRHLSTDKVILLDLRAAGRVIQAAR